MRGNDSVSSATRLQHNRLRGGIGFQCRTMRHRGRTGGRKGADSSINGACAASCVRYKHKRISYKRAALLSEPFALMQVKHRTKQGDHRQHFDSIQHIKLQPANVL